VLGCNPPLDCLKLAACCTGSKWNGPTVRAHLAKEFCQRYLQRERKHPREAELTIQADILRYWPHRPAKSITRRDGSRLLDRIVDRDAPVIANRVCALLSQMFRFGVARGMLEARRCMPTFARPITAAASC
jgi:hypothetical protein